MSVPGGLFLSSPDDTVVPHVEEKLLSTPAKTHPSTNSPSAHQTSTTFTVRRVCRLHVNGSNEGTTDGANSLTKKVFFVCIIVVGGR